MNYFLRHYRIEPYYAPVGEVITPDFGGISEDSSFARTLPREYLGKLLPVRRINWAQTFAFHKANLADYDFLGSDEHADKVVCYKFCSNDQSRIVGRPEELHFWHSPDAEGTVQGGVLTHECYASSFRVSLQGSAALSSVVPPRRLKHLWWVTNIDEFAQGIVSQLSHPGDKLAIAELFKTLWDDTFSLLSLH